jgi:hypothetical protein
MQGVNLPTAVFMTSSIVTTLGYMAPPSLYHLFLDNSWKDWGNALRTRDLWRFRYMPDIIIEHLHPQAGKSEWDEGYVEVNGGEMWTRDETAYKEYVDSGGEAADIAKLMVL